MRDKSAFKGNTDILLDSDGGTFYFVCFVLPHQRHAEVPKLRVESTVATPATAATMPDL